MKFLHSMIRVYDLEKSIKFYTGLFGLKPDYKAELEDCTLYYLLDEVSGTRLELTENYQKPDKKYTNGEAFGHFAFETEDFEAFGKKVKELGYEYLYEPFELVLKGNNTNRPLKVAFIKDPDGNEIEVIEKEL